MECSMSDCQEISSRTLNCQIVRLSGNIKDSSLFVLSRMSSRWERGSDNGAGKVKWHLGAFICVF